MARVLLFALAIGITIYALLDWFFVSKKTTPGKLSRWIWLLVIIFIPILGPATWIILRLVEAAESRGSSDPLPDPTPPDDDSDFLSDVSQKIRRRKGKNADAED